MMEARQGRNPEGGSMRSTTARPDFALRRELVRIVSEKETHVRFCQLNTLLFSEAEPSDKEAALIEFIGDIGQGLRIDNPSQNNALNLGKVT